MSGDLGLMSILDLVVVMTIIMSLIIKCVYDIIRYRTMSNLNFSCLAFIVLITVACAPSDLGADGDLLHFYTLAISMQSYIPSCFLSFCLGERRGEYSCYVVSFLHINFVRFIIAVLCRYQTEHKQ